MEFDSAVQEYTGNPAHVLGVVSVVIPERLEALKATLSLLGCYYNPQTKAYFPTRVETKKIIEAVLFENPVTPGVWCIDTNIFRKLLDGEFKCLKNT